MVLGSLQDPVPNVRFTAVQVSEYACLSVSNFIAGKLSSLTQPN